MNPKSLTLTSMLCLIAAVAPSYAQPRRRPTSNLQAVFDASMPRMQECVVNGLQSSSQNRVSANIRLLIDSRGSVMSITTRTEPEIPAIGTCVEGVVRSLRFPTFRGPMAEIQRNITIAMTPEN